MSRRWKFAGAAVTFGIAGTLLAFLLADVYIHHRFERGVLYNVWGYRGPTVGRKTAGEYRVAVLGGSAAYGFGVRWDESMPALHTQCEIAVVDFSQDRMTTNRLDNDSLKVFLSKPQPKWSKCRWINVNGLSWDVIQTLGQHKRLHRLAVEDILNTRNRTKADW